MATTNPALKPASWNDFPDANGHFGPYGGRFVAETLMEPIEEFKRKLA